MARRSSGRLPSLKRSAPISRFLRFGNPKTYINHPLARKGTITARKRPFAAFFVFLGILFLIIVLNSLLTPRPKEDTTAYVIKEVSTYKIGRTPRILVSAQVEKTGVIKIVALTPGVVSSINVTEGQEVSRGTTLVSLSSNYSGGNAPDIQRQLAEATLSNVTDTYQIQKDLIQKQLDLADKNRDNTEQLRSITADSLNATRNLLSLNQGIVDTLNSNLANLENNNSGGVNDTAILQTKQLISQFQSGVNQLQAQVKTTEYQTDKDNSPTDIANIMQDVTKKQLDIEERALKLSLESSQLQLKLAQVMQATMFPSAPFDGVIERVYVTPGEAVNPGTPLVLIHGAQTLKVVAKVPANIAREVSYTEPTKIHIGDKTFSQLPAYISTEATDGALYSVIFSLPELFQNKLTNNEFIQLDIPVGYPNSIGTIPYVPIDIVFQTEDGAFIYVLNGKKVKARKVDLGSVLGSYVAVQNGIKIGDQVILDRTVISGETVKVKN